METQHSRQTNTEFSKVTFLALGCFHVTSKDTSKETKGTIYIRTVVEEISKALNVATKHTF